MCIFALGIGLVGASAHQPGPALHVNLRFGVNSTIHRVFLLPYPAMTLLRTLKWMASLVLALVIAAVLFVALFGWNWLRAPLENKVLEQTGRA